MDTRESLQVLFCDLCSASVPIQDVDTGAAVKLAGKTIGSCCLGILRGGTGAAGKADVAQMSAAKSSTDSRALSIGVAILAAIAASALFLDYRIGQVELASAAEMERIQASLKSQADVVQDTSVKLDAMASRADMDRIEGLVRSAQAGAESGSAHAQDLATKLDAVRAAVAATQAALQKAEAARTDYGPAFEDLRRRLEQQSAAIAELAAKPRAAVEESAAVPMPAPRVAMAEPSGLPAAIAHQVGRLMDRDEGVRFEAVDELLRSKDARVLPHLLPLAKDPDTFVRRLVIEGLKDLPSRESVDAFIVALADPEQIVRSSAWLSLKAMTKQEFPFDASGNRDARQKAQAKWQEWWEKNRASFGG